MQGDIIKAQNFFSENLLKNDLVAAPLAGISHMPFRRILRKYFNGIIYSEMVSAEGIMRKNPDSLEYLDRHPGESPLVFQLFGGRPESFSEAVKAAEEYVNVEAFDVNAGCPVKKVLKAGGGCALLKDLPRLKEVVKAVRRSTAKPFSIKIRIGFDEKNMVYNQALDIAQSEGADAIIVHGRTRSDMFGGTVRLDILRDMAAISSIPLIANGGVDSYETYKGMKETGAAGVMIGRAMMKAPWIFAAIRDKKPAENYLSPIDIKNLLIEMRSFMEEHAGQRENKRIHYVHILRKFAVWFSKGLDNAADFRVKIYQAQSENEIASIIESFFSASAEPQTQVL